jgi:hypothetical protein
MKTYAVELSGEKALPLLESERNELISRLMAVENKLSVIRKDMGLPDPRAAALEDYKRRARDSASAEIEKTPAGKSVKGQTEEIIASFLKHCAVGPMGTQFIANSVGANYHTALRALKNLLGAELVVTDGELWRRTDKLMTMNVP